MKTKPQVLDQQSWLQLLSIQAGGALCLPVIMLGQLIFQKYGWAASLLIIGFGNLFLLLIGLAFAFLSTHRPQSTVEHATYYFGKRGRLGFAFLMMSCMLGWFAVQLNVMSLSLAQLFEIIGLPIHPLFLNIGLGLLLSAVMCLGMKAMKWLSNISAPLLVLTLVYAFLTTKGTLQAVPIMTISWIGGLSLIIGGGIASVIDLPTFFQHARSKKDACIAIAILYGFVVPFIEGVGIYLSAKAQGQSLLEIFQTGHGLLWMLWICLFVLLCGWTTNNANLYSAIASSYSLFERVKFKTRTLGLGIAGTAIACFNPLESLEAILTVFGITIGSMGAIILANYLLEITEHINLENASLMSWILGIASGLTSLYLGLSITKVAAFDAFLVTACAQVGMTMLKQRKIYETNHR